MERLETQTCHQTVQKRFKNASVVQKRFNLKRLKRLKTDQNGSKTQTCHWTVQKRFKNGSDTAGAAGTSSKPVWRPASRSKPVSDRFDCTLECLTWAARLHTVALSTNRSPPEGARRDGHKLARGGRVRRAAIPALARNGPTRTDPGEPNPKSKSHVRRSNAPVGLVLVQKLSVAPPQDPGK